jgi:hypothetical protein
MGGGRDEGFIDADVGLIGIPIKNPIRRLYSVFPVSWLVK